MHIGKGWMMMRHVIAVLSLVFGVMVCLIVFPSYVYTPALAILIFSVVGIIFGIFTVKDSKMLAILGIVLNGIAFVYLMYLFAALGG